MIYKLEPVDRTIGTIIRNLGLGTEEIRSQDFIEWIADGLEHIGSFYQFETKEKPIFISNYNGELPCDVMEVIRLTEGCQITSEEKSGFHAYTLQKEMEELGWDFNELSLLTQQSQKLGLQKPTSGNILYPIMRYNANLIGNIAANKVTDHDYKITHNKLTVGFENGVVMIQYLALPVDERGYPKVPDNVSFREALFWKVAYHMSMASPKKLQNPALQNPDYCYNKWSYYCIQARAEANAPDPMLEGQIANNFLRLMNNLNEQNQDYRGLNLPQSLDFNGRI